LIVGLVLGFTGTDHAGRQTWSPLLAHSAPCVRDGGLPRSVAKLYLPSAATYFGSREDYGLTYTSCQENRKMDEFFRRLAAEMGMDEATIRAALNRGELQ